PHPQSSRGRRLHGRPALEWGAGWIRFSRRSQSLRLPMRLGLACLALTLSAGISLAQFSVSDLSRLRDYESQRTSSFDRTGANHDYENLKAGGQLVLFDEAGPGEIRHIWITAASPEAYHLKKIVLRMYWDGETSPSVEAPIGDFFGLGLGTY